MGVIASPMRENLGTMDEASILAFSRMCGEMWPLAGEMLQGELTSRGLTVNGGAGFKPCAPRGLGHEATVV